MRSHTLCTIYSIFRIVYGQFFDVFTAAKIKKYYGVIVGNEHLTYKVVYDLFLVFFIINIAFKQFFNKSKQILFCNSIAAF